MFFPTVPVKTSRAGPRLMHAQMVAQTESITMCKLGSSVSHVVPCFVIFRIVLLFSINTSRGAPLLFNVKKNYKVQIEGHEIERRHAEEGTPETETT